MINANKLPFIQFASNQIITKITFSIKTHFGKINSLIAKIKPSILAYNLLFLELIMVKSIPNYRLKSISNLAFGYSNLAIIIKNSKPKQKGICNKSEKSKKKIKPTLQLFDYQLLTY